MMMALRPSKILLMAAGFVALAGITPAQAEYNKPYVGDQKTYIANADDTLVHIARRYGLGFVEMRAANQSVDPWIPGEGVKLVLPSRHLLPDAPRNGIVINLPEMRMYAFLNGENAEPSTYALGIGREGLETPLGSTTVQRKMDGPTWRPTARMLREDPTLKAVVPPGPDNPMGTHAMYLGWPSYAIHGTNKPYGIGRRSSSGCLRLYPENITELFAMTPVGTRVTVVNQPVKLAWIDDVLFMEAHPEMEQALQMEETGQVYAAKMSEQDMALIVAAAGEHQNRLHWATIRNEIRNRSGVPVMIARKEGAEFKEPEYAVIDGRKLNPPAEEISDEEKPAFAVDENAEGDQPKAEGENKPEAADKPVEADAAKPAETSVEDSEKAAESTESKSPAEEISEKPATDKAPEGELLEAEAEAVEGEPESASQPATKSEVNP